MALAEVKLGIRAKLFLVSLALIGTSVLALDVYLRRAIERDLVDRIRNDLFARLTLIVRSVEAMPPDATVDAWDALADDLGRRSGDRVTFIRPDGVVVGDSDVAREALAYVENHALRPEI